MALAGATSPTECALAIAMPVSLDEVRDDLDDPQRHDYAKAMRGLDEVLSARGVWEAHFAPAVGLWKTRKPELEAARVKIIESATLARLRALMEEGFRTITFLGHWKGHEILPADILNGPEIARMLVSDESRVCATLRTLMGPEALDRFAAGPRTNSDRIDMARLLTGAVESAVPLFNMPSSDEMRLALTPLELCELNREQLDIWFGDKLLVAGNCLELRDGLYSANEIAAIVPSNFAGCLHLGNCHSSLLQRAVGSPQLRVLANEEEMLPLPFLETYCVVVSMLQCGGLSYPELWLRVLEQMRGAQIERRSRGWLSAIRRILSRAWKSFREGSGI